MYSIIYNVVNYNRNKIAIESINKLILQQQSFSLVHCIDDCSYEDITDLKNTFNQHPIFIDTYRKLTINEKNLGVEYNNICRLNDEIYDKQDFVYLTDNDMCYSKSFYIELRKLTLLMNENLNVFASTLFNYNTKKSLHPENGNFNDSYVYKQSFGGCSVLIRAKDFRNAMDFYLSEDYDYVDGWDWALCYYAQKQGKKLIATKNSYVQHIGEIGINSQIGNYDYADNFVKQ